VRGEGERAEPSTRDFVACAQARVIKNRLTHKSMGYGFVSFKDPWDMTKALREMQGKYIGNRPVKVSAPTNGYPHYCECLGSDGQGCRARPGENRGASSAVDYAVVITVSCGLSARDWRAGATSAPSRIARGGCMPYAQRVPRLLFELCFKPSGWPVGPSCPGTIQRPSTGISPRQASQLRFHH
jgi:hypothetical protein